MPFFFKLSAFGGALSVLTFPVSVSLSQFGLFLALLGWGLYSLTAGKVSASDRENAGIWEMPFLMPYPMVMVIGLYLTHTASLVYHSAVRDASFYKGFMAEPADIFLTGMAFWTMAFISDPRGRERLFRWLEAAGWITVTAGLIGIFSRVRLSKLPQLLISGSADEGIRLQHHLGSVFFGGEPIHLYMPIGFMNTHLTYAAHLAFFFPFFFLRFLDTWLRQDRLLPRKKTLQHSVMPGIMLILLTANNGRSALLGLSFALLISMWFFIKTYWKKNSIKLVYPAALFLVLLVSAGGVLTAADALFPGRLHLLDRISNPFQGKAKSTDYQRQFLWQAVSDIIVDRPVTGTGPGLFESAVEERILEYSKEKPQLWFGYEIIQRGHAHNDYLNQWAVSGVLAFILYVSFVILLFYSSLSPSADSLTDLWKWGPLMIITAGFFQCYFTDDETLLPFWVFSSLIMQNDYRNRKDD